MMNDPWNEIRTALYLRQKGEATHIAFDHLAQRLLSDAEALQQRAEALEQKLSSLQSAAHQWDWLLVPQQGDPKGMDWAFEWAFYVLRNTICHLDKENA